ncbi:3'-5' exonuclease [Ramlibacter terrae]|uniref:3'-5' exonuclease n=1 Tax=Ramlibacter terrae TaxID=2732511 RepID=A0ABX6P806_9BURK|nr:3'-5' exonuclease [Ramlibacter terrae]
MWWDRARSDPGATRCVVLDVETSGLDTARDWLLAIAAVGVRIDWPAGRLSLLPADSFEVVLRQELASPRDNILLHGIGVQRQREGVPMADGLRGFIAAVGDAPLLAFHAAFDQALIVRHARDALGLRLPNSWLDIEHLCAVTHPKVRARALDDWLAHFGIGCAVRHQAAADTGPNANCSGSGRRWRRNAAAGATCSGWPRTTAGCAAPRSPGGRMRDPRRCPGS